jgi:D-sedoheptulose 7-phosphate isomerase
MRCWAFTGPAPNPLADACTDVVAVPSADPQVVQELHLVSTHVLCEYVDLALPAVFNVHTRGSTERRGSPNGRHTPEVAAATSRTGT